MSHRADRLVALLDDAGVGCLLVTDLTDVRYLTGFTGSNGLALLGPEIRVFATDFRYVDQAGVEVDSSYDQVRDSGSGELFGVLSDLLPAGELQMGFDDRVLTVRQHARLRELLPDSVALVTSGGLVERLRVVKEPGEITQIRAAAQIADDALQAVLQSGLIGRTERAVAEGLHVAMRERGAQRLSFDSIVAAGEHGALPHAQPRDVEITAGQLVTIDWGAEVDGYCSDCTRTYAAGAPSDRSRDIYELVLRAQLAGCDAVRAGAGGREVDAVAREIIAAAGHGEHFGHGLGHGVGLQVHEAPRLSTRSQDTLRASSVVTVEPGVYLPGELGVRIEDLVVVGEDGPEILTSLSKALTVIE